MIMVEYPSLLSPLPTPTPTHNLYFSSGLLSLPSGDTPYSSICPPRLVVGCLCKCRFLGSSQPSTWGILVADSRIFIFINSSWVRGSRVPKIWEPLLQSICDWLVISDETNIMQCFFWSALLLKSRLPVGQNRLSPCKWGVKGHNFMGSHLSLSQRHFRLAVCLH